MDKVNPVPSFEQIWQYLGTQSYIPSFKVISLLVPKNFWRFLPYMGLEGILVMWPKHLNRFSSKHPMETIYEIWLQTVLLFFRKRRSLKMLSLSDLRQKSPWVVINHHVLIYLTLCTNFHLSGFNSFLEVYSLSIFPYKNKRDQIWSCCKIGHGQPRINIWTNLVVLE